MEDDNLIESVVIRAGQRPAMMLYVPLSIFLLEMLIGLALFRLVGFWVFTLVPIHFYFVVKTAGDYHWLSTLKADVYHWWLFVANKGLQGKKVVTFCAEPPKARTNDYDGLF
ncbi:MULTISPECIES: VirB3 family type IV secretion system protein [Burkholderia]|jgi:type IV secretory pathway VirB3-like protein|uniref:VirB3 family type IV secretion system protein n=1 Tax=Burkholderia contaminans TaxID=488447 RepID=A0A1E3FNH4_9BURK|nr:VirB3 family type IV secretion system protein [Burkholderia contaminans]ELK7724882.1 VirB3 family type IV secretion system protein [Burkholderia cenocepacia]UTP27825.1 VirB3 family type IV secretion system protein [Burkholderia sp. FXe9]HBN6128172.1 VirB3 family type IV secretion system protein [Clostridioides difficile]MBA9833407.1 hypothetical protein [Burkholderia contaminans]MBH9693779.1 VirB3 family type IV secretion system protein [Burkholderia contaminans]